jgi:hypothetical protein
LRERTTSGGDATTDSEASPLKKVVKFEGEIDRYHPRFYRLGGSTC